MSVDNTLVPDLELPLEQPFEQLSEIAGALESFHRQLSDRSYVGGTNPVAETVLDLAPVASLEQYEQSAFKPALEATQSKWKDFIEKLLQWIRNLIAGTIMWFKSKLLGSIDDSTSRHDKAVAKLENIHEAIQSTEGVVEHLAETENTIDSDPETRINKAMQKFSDSFSGGLGACIVKLGFAEIRWQTFLEFHFRLCVHITEEVTEQADLIAAILEQRKSLKGQLAGDVRKATDARNALEKSLGVDVTPSKTVEECINANIRMMHLLEHTTEIKVNPKYILTNSVSVAAMILSMDSKQYRENAAAEIRDSESRLEDIAKGVERVEKQLMDNRDTLEAESSAALRGYVKELRLAITGLQAGSRWHIRYVTSHTNIIAAFTEYYYAVASVSAEKHSPATLIRFTKALKT